MSSIPVEVVVELLMAEVMTPIDGGCVVWVGKIRFHSTSVEGLRTSVRDYLLTLVPQPKLLSECEEGIEYLMMETPRRVCREFIYAVDIERQQRIARADQVRVIQQVEVQK